MQITPKMHRNDEHLHHSFCNNNINNSKITANYLSIKNNKPKLTYSEDNYYNKHLVH